MSADLFHVNRPPAPELRAAKQSCEAMLRTRSRRRKKLTYQAMIESLLAYTRRNSHAR